MNIKEKRLKEMDERDVFNLVGLGFYTSKNNVEYRTLQLTQQFNDSKYGIGFKVQQEFVKKDYCPDGLAPGHRVRFTYGKSFKGEAYVNGVFIVDDKAEIPTVQVKK